MYVEFVVDFFDVEAHGVVADLYFGRDHFVAEALHKEAQYLGLAVGEVYFFGGFIFCGGYHFQHLPGYGAGHGCAARPGTREDS